MTGDGEEAEAAAAAAIASTMRNALTISEDVTTSAATRPEDDIGDAAAAAAAAEAEAEANAEASAAMKRLPTERYDGPGVPYAHKFTTVLKGPVGVATLGGVCAVDHVCWNHVLKRPCLTAASSSPAGTTTPSSVTIRDAEARPPTPSPAGVEPPQTASDAVATAGEEEEEDDGDRAARGAPSGECKLAHVFGFGETCSGRIREALGRGH